MASNDLEDDSGPGLPDDIYEQVTALAEKANEALESDRPSAAIEPLQRALDLLPAPQHEWEAWTWLNGSLGEAYFNLSDFKMARISFLDAMSGPGGEGNPYLLLRVGQSAFELGETAQAKQMLAQAHMQEGDELFSDEDPKYLAFLRSDR
ncbi:tetratricopeptide repeat protein [Acidovorax sp. SUPP2539]|nr:tetratricopeptide repeat protein [Acidovorax sp. SUPP2539]